MAQGRARFAPVFAILFLVGAQLWLAFRAWHFDHDALASWPPAVEIVALLLVPALVAAAICRPADERGPRCGPLWLMFAAGAVMRLVHFPVPPIAETDHYRYLWDGALVAHGYDPYAWAPLLFSGDPAVIPGHDPQLLAIAETARAVTARINFPDLTSIYPGVSQIVFAAAHLMAPFDVRGLRIITITADLATLVLLIRWLDRLARPRSWAAVFWLNPLLVLGTANQVHVDAVVPPFLLAALLAADRLRALSAGLFLGLAAGVKLWPLLLLPLVARRLATPLADWRRGALCIATALLAAGLVTAPVFLSAAERTSGLAAYAMQWSNNNGFYAWASWLAYAAFPELPTEPALRVAVAATAGLVALIIARAPLASSSDLIARSLIVAAATFYLSPVQLPWYATWFLPLAALTGSRPLAVATALLPIYYTFFPLAAAGARDTFLYGVAFLPAVPVLVWLVLEWRSAQSRPPNPGARDRVSG